MTAPVVSVEPWAPEYGTPVDGVDALSPTDAAVDVTVERAASAWVPLAPAPAARAAACAVFVDGMRRVDARVWVLGDDGDHRAGLCASYAAGTVRCDTAGRVETAVVRRVLVATAGAPALATRAGTYDAVAVASDRDDDLTATLQRLMRDLEASVARDVTGADLAVVDGPLRGREAAPSTVGYVKTHHVQYLPAIVGDVVARLRPGRRTPLFVVSSGSGGRWSRYSWYLRLPTNGGTSPRSPVDQPRHPLPRHPLPRHPLPRHPWAGVVRCEASAELALDDVRRLADTATVTLPRFASTPHKDPRAPQNLYPIAALERALRRRLGDPAVCYRLLRAASDGR